MGMVRAHDDSGGATRGRRRRAARAAERVEERGGGGDLYKLGGGGLNRPRGQAAMAGGSWTPAGVRLMRVSDAGRAAAVAVRLGFSPVGRREFF